MFERNKVDNSVQQMSVPAEITLDSGEILRGRFLISAARSIYEVLNGNTYFLDFETYAGERSLLSRAAIKAVKITNVPNANHLKGRMRETESFDPHVVLGVEIETPFEQVRASFVKLSKIYHPDRFAGVDLPPEVKDYLAAMARRVNTAYAVLEAPVQAQRRAALEKSKPVYTSAMRT